MKPILAAALLLAVPAMAQDREDWRRVATDEDRARLRDWRTAWIEALAQARASDAAGVAAAGVLLDPDRSLARPLPPAGAYNCRLVRLGAKRAGMAPLIGRPPVRCRLDGARFEVLDGEQRPVGRVYDRDEGRAVFLGSLRFSEEKRGLPYGRDLGRNVAGYIERIGEQRWRLVLPRPRFDAVVDVIEIRPAI